MNWHKVEPNPADNDSKPETLPPLDKVVWVIYLSDFDDAPVMAFGGRVDDGEGWLWALDEVYGFRADQTWNTLIADDEYRVTQWAEIEWPEEMK